jgi:mono/diheme cytochrome c family protein
VPKSRKAARRLLTVALALGLVGIGAAGAGLFMIRHRLAKTFEDVPLVALRGPAMGDRTEGERLARIYGCFSCHGDNLTGQEFYGIPSANLTRVVRAYTAEEFARVLRRGVKRDGTSLTWNMPSDFFSGVADDEVRHIYAYLRGLPQRPDGVRRPLMPLAYIGLLTGDMLLSAEVSRDGAPPAKAPSPDMPGYGKYLAEAACSECHGYNLGGNAGDTPPLAMAVKSYSPEAFAHFMKTGTSVGGMNDLPLMSSTARERFRYLRQDEVEALHTYLIDLPQD